MHIEFTLSSACPVMCNYCPQQEYISAFSETSGKRYTTLESFKKMVANLENTVEEIHFSGFTEAFTNPKWFEIVEYAVQSRYKIVFYSTFYKVSKEDISKLTTLSLDKIFVHVKNELDYEEKYKFIKNNCELNGIDFEFLHFEDVLDEQQQENAVKKELHSRAGNTNINTSYIKGRVKCRYNREKCNVVLPNGDVHICCMDFGLKYKIGNLLNTNLSEIQDSIASDTFIKDMVSENDSFCNYCYFAVPL